MNGIFLLTGGNLGDRKSFLEKAAYEINDRAGQIMKASAYYETAAWGKTDEPPYLNQALEIRSEHSPHDLLQICLDIEKKLGRERRLKWAGRQIDIDILFYGSEVIHLNNLEIPHPFMAQRRFVLTPLAEIAPDLIHPVSGLSIRDMLAICPDPLPVRKWPEEI